MNGKIVTGDVIAAAEDRISVRAEGIPIEKDSLFINPALMKGYDPKLSGSVSGTEGTFLVEAGALTTAEGQLTAGDKVLLFTADSQHYYLICRVVAYG